MSRASKPSERPQLVARLFKALSGPDKKAIQTQGAKTFAGKDAVEQLLLRRNLTNKLKNSLIDDFEDTPSVGTARSRPWSMPRRSLQSATTAMSRRILEKIWNDHSTLTSGTDRSS